MPGPERAGHFEAAIAALEADLRGDPTDLRRRTILVILLYRLSLGSSHGMSLVTELLAPIAGAHPGGSNLRYEAIYDQIKLARTEEVDAPQGEWLRARKTADYGLVVKLAREVLAKRSKDLQVAAWLTEALTYREGFAGLASGLELLHALLGEYWDYLYPELEDGDVELRAAPLEWVGGYLEAAVRSVPLNAAGHGLSAYRESRAVGYEVKGYDPARTAARAAAIAEGKLTAEEFDEGFATASKGWYRALSADLERALTALDALDLVSQERFGAEAPGYHKLRDLLREVQRAVDQLLARKLEADPDPATASEVAGTSREGLGGVGAEEVLGGAGMAGMAGMAGGGGVAGEVGVAGTVGVGAVVGAGAAGAASAHRGVAASVAGSDTGDDVIERARELARSGEHRPALELLLGAAARERSPRVRFRWRVQATGIMVDAGLERVALPILRDLLEVIEEHRLEGWEAGELVAEPLGLLYRCLERTGEDPGVQEELYLRICRLDPMLAIRLAGTSSDRSRG